jgi:hypothetical protein
VHFLKKINYPKICTKLKLFYSFFFIALFFHQQTTAQKVSLNLKVLNVQLEPFENATAFLYRLPDSVIIEKKVLKSTDIFLVEQSTDYFLKITATSKQIFEKAIKVKLQTIQLEIILMDKVESMKGITIVSKKSFIKEEDDKTIVDATALTNSSTNAFEVIEKTPGTIIDQDGNVYLNSTTPATIFLNGREMKLSNADLASLLKSLPANSVSKIEIMRNPSAKYDAASSGGILNIVLKKGVKVGTNGSLNIATFQGLYNTSTIGFNINKGTTKFNSYLSYQFTKKNSFESIISNRNFDIDSVNVSQNSYTKYPSITNYLSAGTDYAINNKWSIGVDLKFNTTKNENKSINNINISKMNFAPLLAKNNSNVLNNNNTFFCSNTFSSKYKIDSSGSEWANSLDYSIFNYHNSQQYTNNNYSPAVSKIYGDGENDNDKKSFSFQSDLVLKSKKGYTVETGIKLSNNKSNNNAVYYKDSTGQNRQLDFYQTNKYAFKENINAAYIQVSKTVLGFTIKPGLRFEATDISGNQIVPFDTNFSIKRNDVFPYVYLKHKLFKIYGQTLMANAIFRKSIKRPFYESLNPFPKFVDPFLYEVGNPALRPQFTTNYEFNVTFNEMPVASVGVNYTKDIFSNVIYQDNATKIAFRTFDNLGKNKEIYCRLVGGIPPGGKYFFYVGGLYNYNEYRGVFQNESFNYNRGSFTFFTFHEYKFTKSFTFNLQAFLRSKALQNFYELNNFGGMFVSMNKSILKKKANIILSVNDVLQTNRVSFQFNRNNQIIDGKRINDTRRLGLTFRYNIGAKPKEEKKNGFEAPAEAKE